MARGKGLPSSSLKLFLFLSIGEEEGWLVINKVGQSRQAVSDPEEMMKKALGWTSYDGLVVVD